MTLVPQLEFSFYLSNVFWTATFSLLLYSFIANIFSKKLSLSIKNRSQTLQEISQKSNDLILKISKLSDEIEFEKGLISKKASEIENLAKQKIVSCKVRIEGDIKSWTLKLSSREAKNSIALANFNIDSVVFDKLISTKKAIFSAIDGKN